MHSVAHRTLKSPACSARRALCVFLAFVTLALSGQFLFLNATAQQGGHINRRSRWVHPPAATNMAFKKSSPVPHAIIDYLRHPPYISQPTHQFDVPRNWRREPHELHEKVHGLPSMLMDKEQLSSFVHGMHAAIQKSSEHPANDSARIQHSTTRAALTLQPPQMLRAQSGNEERILLKDVAKYDIPKPPVLLSQQSHLKMTLAAVQEAKRSNATVQTKECLAALGSIPPAIHTVESRTHHWDRQTISTRFENTWGRGNPCFRVFVHTNAECMKLAAAIPELIHLFVFSSGVSSQMQSDVCSLLLLFEHGGIFVDFELIPLVPLQQWFDGSAGIVLVKEKLPEGEHLISNWFFGARPKHPCIRRALDYVIKQVGKLAEKQVTDSLVAEEVTGIKAFTAALKQCVTDVRVMHYSGHQISSFLKRHHDQKGD